MAEKSIANENYTLGITNLSPGVSVFGVPNETRILALKSKVDEKKILLSAIQYSFTAGSPCVLPMHTFISGIGSIQATAIKTKCDGLPVMREGDSGSCSGSFTNNNSGLPVSCSCTLRIANAGQTKVKAE
jgi:hypothetical protein